MGFASISSVRFSLGKALLKKKQLENWLELKKEFKILETQDVEFSKMNIYNKQTGRKTTNSMLPML